MAARKFELPSGAPARAPRGARRAYKSREYTEEQQRELLENYVAVDPTLWPAVQAGDHVRYVTTENEFRRGGFVAIARFTNPKAEEKRDLMRLSAYAPGSGGNSSGPAWVVPWDTVQELYVQPGATLLALQAGVESNITILSDNTQKLAAALQKLLDGSAEQRAGIAALQRRVDALERR